MSKEKTTDSVSHTEERRARIKAESERLNKEAEAADAERAAKDAARYAKSNEEDAVSLEKHAQLVSNEETRDQLLDRVRKMREATPEFVNAPLGMTEFSKEILSVEQQAGRDAIARVEAEREKAAEQRKKNEDEIRAREGTMSAVHQPNPGQEEQFPTTGATLGKKK